MAPLEKLVHDFVSPGGRILVCMLCINERETEPDMLVDEAEITASSKVIIEALEADATLNY